MSTLHATVWRFSKRHQAHLEGFVICSIIVWFALPAGWYAMSALTVVPLLLLACFAYLSSDPPPERSEPPRDSAGAHDGPASR